MFTTDPNNFKIIDAFDMNGCDVSIFLSGRKDDEMDPMDPSAYSDAPRYNIDSHNHETSPWSSL